LLFGDRPVPVAQRKLRSDLKLMDQFYYKPKPPAGNMGHLSNHPFDEPLVELHEALTEQQEPLTEPHEPLIEQHEPLVELLADPLNQTKGLAVEAVAALCW
jgi:hypothetical protein